MLVDAKGEAAQRFYKHPGFTAQSFWRMKLLFDEASRRASSNYCGIFFLTPKAHSETVLPAAGDLKVVTKASAGSLHRDLN